MCWISYDTDERSSGRITINKASMKEPLQSNETFTKLLETAAEFLQARCWEWMDDTNIFGVQNPDNGEVGYCCVMGNAGELFGLGVYLGSMGLLSYEMVATGVLQPGDLEVFSYQSCLMVDFEDRRALRTYDLELIKNSGLKFRGRNSWPRFTSYRPGYVPWKLTVEEARFLTIAIQQALAVALRFKEDRALLNSPDPGEMFFVSVPEKVNGAQTWTGQWLKPAAIEVEDYPLDSLDEVRLQRIAKRISSRPGTWEIDLFLAPMIIGGKSDPEERPSYGRIFLCVDRDSFSILDSLVASRADGLAGFRARFIEVLATHLVMPETILVRKPEVFDLLQPVAEKLGFGLSLSTSLRSLDQARDALFGFLETGQM
jgi:uncharacterized protein DUF6930